MNFKNKTFGMTYKDNSEKVLGYINGLIYMQTRKKIKFQGEKNLHPKVEIPCGMQDETPMMVKVITVRK